jgi:CheY-like chemotaxis protein
LKVLLVDDDFRNIFAMTAILERADAQVIVAESGAEAIAALNRMPDIDLVLMDIMMPIMDGYTTIRAIRTMDHFTTLPIVAVTGKVVPGERERCLEAGANECIAKPIDTAGFIAALAPFLAAKAQSGQ